MKRAGLGESLGVLLQDWKPQPRKDCPSLANTGAMLVDFLQVVMLGSAVVGSFLVVKGVLGRPGNPFRDPIWWMALALLVAVPFWSLRQLLEARHRRRRLAIYPGAVCFDGKCVQLEDIESVSTGEFKMLFENHIPTLEKVAVHVNEPLTGGETISGAAKARQTVRDQSLTFHKRSGEQVHWACVLALFPEASIREFFTTLNKQAPHIRLDLSANLTPLIHE